MGGGFSRLFPCLKPADQTQTQIQTQQSHQPDLFFTEPLDETLGHSFCYVPSSSARFLSPSHSDRLSPSNSLRLSPSHDPKTTLFKSISGASVSANTSAPRTLLQQDHIYEQDATDFTAAAAAAAASRSSTVVNGFESTSSFTALPLQPVPRGGGGCDASGPIDRGFFMSGPIERGALSGPLDVNAASDGGGVHFSAPLGGLYVKRRRKKGISDIRKAFYRNFSDKKRPWVVPVLNFVGRKEAQSAAAAATAAYGGGCSGELEGKNDSVQWAHGKAGEDRVHVVVSEEHGWLFVGIYDGFNGPDAPEFLMGNLYRAVFNELHGLFWKNDDDQDRSMVTAPKEEQLEDVCKNISLTETEQQLSSQEVNDPQLSVKRVTFEPEQKSVPVRKPLWELLAEDGADDGLDLSGSNRFAFSVDDALRLSNAGTGRRRRSLLLSKLRYGFSKSTKEGGRSRDLFPWKYDWEEKEKIEVENRSDEKPCRNFRKRTVGPIDHELVLRALSRALEITESAYLEMTDKVLDRYPELALMGSCLLVVLMRDEDVYVMNVGDSRAVVAQYQPQATDTSSQRGANDGGEMEGIVEESSGAAAGDQVDRLANEAHAERMKLTALQLSTDHSTSIEEEVLRIKEEHPDDSQCIVNDRVKGRLKVTRAFGAGFLKQPKLNGAVLEMFRNDYIGTAPYISCHPSLRHHKLGASDQFLVLSSDGLYQYLTNEEVVSLVEEFMEKFPDGDPAQHLIEELLSRAAKKAGMDFHELLDIPQGDRRKYHDDVTVMVVSLEGRIWKSSGKYL